VIDAFDVFAFEVFAAFQAAAVVVVVTWGKLPGRIARERGHSPVAVHAAGRLGVAALGIWWPLCEGLTGPVFRLRAGLGRCTFILLDESSRPQGPYQPRAWLDSPRVGGSRFCPVAPPRLAVRDGEKSPGRTGGRG
jgi:hypothetical protein